MSGGERIRTSGVTLPRVFLGDYWRARLSRADFGIFLILLLPWMLFSVGANWISDYVFGHPWIDDWIYVGFFLDLRKHLELFRGTYYGSRLSWILPGYIAYKLFQPRIADYILHVGVYYAAALPLYFTLKHMACRRAALVAALLMGGYGYFLWAVGWDYVDGAGIAYFLLTTLALTLASKNERAWNWLMLAGLFYGAMIYSQLFLVVFTPPLLFYYFAANRGGRRHSFSLGIVHVTLGFLVITILLGMVNYRLGGDFLFYGPSVRTAIDLARTTNPWRRPFQLWWKQATWLVMPSLAFVSCLAFLWKFRFDRSRRSLALLQLYFLSCVLIFVLVEIKGTPVLQYLYYASFLVPPLFLALGAQIGPRIERLSFGLFALVTCEAIATPFLAYRFLPTSRLDFWLNSNALSLFLALSFLGIVLLSVKEHPAKSVLLCSLACAAVGLGSAASGYFRVLDADASNYGLGAIVQSVQTVRSVEPSGNLLFWYRLNEPMGNFYRAIASTYLWGYSLVNERFPSLDQGGDSYQIPANNKHMVILSNENDAFLKADSALHKLGLTAELVAERRIQGGPIGWNMIFVKLEQSQTHGALTTGDVDVSPEGWPEAIRLGTQADPMVSLAGPAVHLLFRSDLDSTIEWEVNRYGRSGGLRVQSTCLLAGESCGLYMSGDTRDHLASPFVSLGSAKPAYVFFSIWVKPTEQDTAPRIFIQREGYLMLADGRELLSQKDGWVLYGNWTVSDAKQVRLVVQEPPGSSSLLDKALLLEVPSELPTVPTVIRQKTATGR
jgi:hypothetical protein